MFAKIINGVVVKYPYTEADLKDDNPQTCFPKNIPTEMFKEWGAEPVNPTSPPPGPQIYTETTPVFNAETGSWETAWVGRDRTPEEILEQTENQTKKIRNQRNELLANSDWVVIRALETGTPMSSDWVGYRQFLRDITKQPTFPWDIVWPLEPK